MNSSVWRNSVISVLMLCIMQLIKHSSSANFDRFSGFPEEMSEKGIPAHLESDGLKQMDYKEQKQNVGNVDLPQQNINNDLGTDFYGTNANSGPISVDDSQSSTNIFTDQQESNHFPNANIEQSLFHPDGIRNANAPSLSNPLPIDQTDRIDPVQYPNSQIEGKLDNPILISNDLDATPLDDEKSYLEPGFSQQLQNQQDEQSLANTPILNPLLENSAQRASFHDSSVGLPPENMGKSALSVNPISVDTSSKESFRPNQDILEDGSSKNQYHAQIIKSSPDKNSLASLFENQIDSEEKYKELSQTKNYTSGNLPENSIEVALVRDPKTSEAESFSNHSSDVITGEFDISRLPEISHKVTDVNKIFESVESLEDLSANLLPSNSSQKDAASQNNDVIYEITSDNITGGSPPKDTIATAESRVTQIHSITNNSETQFIETLPKSLIDHNTREDDVMSQSNLSESNQTNDDLLQNPVVSQHPREEILDSTSFSENSDHNSTQLDPDLLKPVVNSTNGLIKGDAILDDESVLNADNHSMNSLNSLFDAQVNASTNLNVTLGFSKKVEKSDPPELYNTSSNTSPNFNVTLGSFQRVENSDPPSNSLTKGLSNSSTPITASLHEEHRADVLSEQSQYDLNVANNTKKFDKNLTSSYPSNDSDTGGISNETSLGFVNSPSDYQIVKANSSGSSNFRAEINTTIDIIPKSMGTNTSDERYPLDSFNISEANNYDSQQGNVNASAVQTAENTHQENEQDTAAASPTYIRERSHEAKENLSTLFRNESDVDAFSFSSQKNESTENLPQINNVSTVQKTPSHIDKMNVEIPAKSVLNETGNLQAEPDFVKDYGVDEIGNYSETTGAEEAEYRFEADEIETNIDNPIFANESNNEIDDSTQATKLYNIQVHGNGVIETTSSYEERENDQTTEIEDHVQDITTGPRENAGRDEIDGDRITTEKPLTDETTSFEDVFEDVEEEIDINENPYIDNKDNDMMDDIQDRMGNENDDTPQDESIDDSDKKIEVIVPRRPILPVLMLLLFLILLLMICARLPSYLYSLWASFKNSNSRLSPFSRRWSKKGYSIIPMGDKSV